MVAKIITGRSIRGALHYNENKVNLGEAKLIMACGFAGEIERMDFSQKLNRFRHLVELKPTVKTNCLHISLNFDSGERLDDAKMQQISSAYMDRLGFGEQPFLVYRHLDAAHQHFHIVSTSIKIDGTAISLHNIGRLLSEPARIAIEKEFGLLVATEKKKFDPVIRIKPAEAGKVYYGKLPTKKAISNVLTQVIGQYSYGSLAKLNAVLRCYNVVADRGDPDSEMFKRKGLRYSILDAGGAPVGVPIKASSFYSKPNLADLQKRFESNALRSAKVKLATAKKLDWVLFKYQQISLPTLLSEFRKQGVDLVIRRNDQGLIYGATYVDHRSKAVFNGSELGKQFTAKGISEILALKDVPKRFLSEKNSGLSTNLEKSLLQASGRLMDGLLGRPEQNASVEMPKNKRKKRKLR